jgi:YrbI family 3-deoxy-D-manno-octulosonate 8-phosphate phosphatase
MFNTQLAKIKLLAMDVDGTLTDGGVFYDTNGVAMKKFSILDGMGLSLLHQNNILTLFITGDKSEISLRRAEKLKITHTIRGSLYKLRDLKEFMQSVNVTAEEVCYIGDDINDLECLGYCGLSACPNDAMPQIKAKVDIIMQHNGGAGAVRELCEMILSAKGIEIREKL